MTLGVDIIEAVNRGGLANWTTSPKQPCNQFTMRRKRDETQIKMDKIYDNLKGWMTIAELSRESGYNAGTTYKYVLRLMDAGRVVRSQKGQPYSYRRK